MPRRARIVPLACTLLGIAAYSAAYWRISRRAEERFREFEIPVLFYCDPSTPEGFRRHYRLRLFFLPINEADHLLTGFPRSAGSEPLYALE